ncbi:MAG TPA: diacylglycerol kinase family protein [Armatimonadota bacterium]|nr:diacylglycerol kinase family protein [Armatimonadota bacterium]
MPGAPALLIANPGAGRGRTRRLAPLLARALAARYLEVDLRFTRDGDDAAHIVRAAVAAGCDRVVVAGGDGTINSVVGALAHTPVALGVIPTGMANAFARELRIPRAWRRACDLAAGWRRRVIDVARAGDRHFALMAGIGFDAQVVARVNPAIKRWLGPAAFVLAGLGCMRRCQPARVCLRWDGGEFDRPAFVVAVANGAHYTYEWRLAPDARLDDGLLDVVVFGWHGWLDPAAHVVGALVGTHLRRPGVTALRTRRLRIECDPPLPLHLDGDAAGVSPVEVEILPEALTVLAPAPPAATRAARHCEVARHDS